MSKRRGWRAFSLIAAGGAVLIVAGAMATRPARMSADALPERQPDLANGRIMFEAGGCASCHARPDQDDRTRLGGGRALRSPFGTFHVPNISPHAQDGIGRWTEADFVSAMINGTSPDNRHYYPAFPYASYRSMKLADVRDLFAYLKTLPAMPGKSRDHELGFPFNMRAAIGAWKLLFLDAAEFEPDPARSAQWNRGAYLVNGPAHCAECHSPRNVLGAIDRARRFAGGPNPEGEGWVPNITQQRLANWSEADIALLLESGDIPDGDSVGGSMREVVRSTSRLPPSDRAAMAAYIKSLRPVEGPPRPARP